MCNDSETDEILEQVFGQNRHSENILTVATL